LKASERVQYKLATMVYRSLNCMAPDCLAADLRRLSDRDVCKPQPFLTNAIQFNAKPSPADSHGLAAEKYG